MQGRGRLRLKIRNEINQVQYVFLILSNLSSSESISLYSHFVSAIFLLSSFNINSNGVKNSVYNVFKVLVFAAAKIKIAAALGALGVWI